MRFTIVATFTMMLAGCATEQAYAPPPTIDVPFSAAEMAWASAKGSGALAGAAVIRTVGGEARTCAGLPAILVPVSSYSSARMDVIYGSHVAGFAPVAQLGRSEPAMAPGFSDFVRTTTCDAEGKFSFGSLPEGEYFVATRVTWIVPRVLYGGAVIDDPQGGAIMQRVKVAAGQVTNVVLAP